MAVNPPGLCASMLTSAGVFLPRITPRASQMKYDKPVRTFEEQADLLLARGLIADRSQLIRRLRVTNYFRLTAYLYRFRAPGSERYQQGTTLDQVGDLYTFDQRLRTLLLDAIEAIEVHTRTQLAFYFAHDHGPFAYSDSKHLPNLKPDKFIEWQRKLDDQVGRSLRSKEDFVTHFFSKYGDAHTRLPIWILVELMDFGAVLTFYRGVNDGIQKCVAAEVGQPDRVVESWLLALNTVRNRCAHHARLWDWEMGTPVLVPAQRKHPDWHAPRLPNMKIGIILMLCRFWLNRIAPTHDWTRRATELFANFPISLLHHMGLPEDWQQHPLWREGL